MEQVETIEMTETKLEWLREGFLMRLARTFAIRRDWPRFSLVAGLLMVPSEFLGRKLLAKFFEGPAGKEELSHQAREGRDIFQRTRPTAEEQELGKLCEKKYKKTGDRGNIVSEIGQMRGKALNNSEIEEVVLYLINHGRSDLAKQAANGLPSIKRSHILAILQ